MRGEKTNLPAGLPQYAEFNGYLDNESHRVQAGLGSIKIFF